MIGIHYVTNEKGQKVAALIDLKRHGELLEDLLDITICDARFHEKDVPFEAYEAKRKRRKKN